MTPDRLKQVIAMTGEDRKQLARLLGFASDNSLRQAETGKITLSPARATWLEGYGRIRSKHQAALAEWLKRNPPPAQNRG